MLHNRTFSYPVSIYNNDVDFERPASSRPGPWASQWQSSGHEQLNAIDRLGKTELRKFRSFKQNQLRVGKHHDTVLGEVNCRKAS